MHPNYEGMTVTERQFAKDEYEKKRKAFTNQNRAKRLKEAALNKEKVESFTGCLHPTLRIMAEAEKSRLKAGHTFPDKEIPKLCEAKEAIHHSVHFHVPHSEVRQYNVYGKMFAVEANNIEMTNGYYVNMCSVSDGDDFSQLDTSQYDSKEKKRKTPFTTAMTVPLILRVIAVDPSVTNRTLWSFLEQYGKAIFFIDPIIQEARTQACVELFGMPDTNIKYAKAIMHEMQAQGHIAKVKGRQDF